MAKIEAYPVLDFSGGVRRDKSLLELQKNELLEARNIEIDERGRLRSRLGSQQVGNTLTGSIENSFMYSRLATGSTPTVKLLVNNMASTGVVSYLVGTRLTVDVAVGDTTVTVNDSALFDASGVTEIDGDLISYTSAAAGVFNGVTGITSAHTIGAPVHQWETLTQSGTAVTLINVMLNYPSFSGPPDANLS